ncbi:MAG: LptF/LptG family permease [Candidatus Bipolaricaulota bacterium]|nr:LptF/LptG family permease [Candidatus Bipolaricaulota bacterium]
MHRRVDRYLAREIVPPFLVAILAFLVFIGLELVISLSDTVFAPGAGAAELLRLVLYKLPTLFTYAIPAAALLATFLALGRLAADRELLAFQALGYSLRRLIAPFLLFGALASGASFALSEYAVPPAEAAYRREFLALVYRGAVPQVQQAVFFRGLYGETYYVERSEGDRLRGILVYDLTGRIYPVEGRFPTVITAQEGRFQGGTLELLGGRVMRFSPEGTLAELVRFERLTVEVEEDLRRAVLGGKTPAEMSLRELGARIELLRKSGLDPRSFSIEYHAKIAVSVASFVFVLFGAPLGALLGRRGRAAGAIAGFLLAAAAQGTFVWTRTLAQRGLIPAYLGAWIPHLGFGLLGLLLFLVADRLRLRGVLPFLFLLVLGAPGGDAAPPPFTALRAEELVLTEEGRAIEARGARAEFGDYALRADLLRAREGEPGWEVEAEGAVLSGKDGELRAGFLSALLGPEGELAAVSARGFTGSSAFRGPEKEETILFSGEEGRAEFAAGKLVRVEARGVRFTTCPCLEDSPYAVEAGEFVLVPEKWLLARSITVRSFGVPVGWLPLYVARLGEEAFPLFPEVGWTGTELFLRWAIPWAVGERVVGAVGVTVYPARGRLDPSLRAAWEGGSLALTPSSLALRVAGELGAVTWSGSLSLTPTAQGAVLRGRVGDWDWAVAWGQTERGGSKFERRPEVSLGRTERGWLGGDLDFRLSGGLFREGEVEAWRLALSLAWSGRWTIGPLQLTLPWSLAFARYGSEERIAAGGNPSLSWGPLSLTYGGRAVLGRSPFGFDAEPPQSQVTVGITAKVRGWQERLSWGWDLAAGGPLPLRWAVSGPGFSSDLSFTLPLAVTRARWSLALQRGPGKLTLDGGLRDGKWEDTVLRGTWNGETLDAFLALRVGMAPVQLLRLAGSGEWRLSPEWALAASWEHDLRAGRLVQLEGKLVRTFAGCLRLGVSLGLSGLRLSLEVPAFPQAKLRFAPQDEGLRIGD